jgi:phosphate starvation-inducible protein PhoH and related proteins
VELGNVCAGDCRAAPGLSGFATENQYNKNLERHDYEEINTSMKKNIGISPNIETLFGTRDENVRVLEDGLNIAINLRSNAIELEGAARDVARAEQVFADYDSLQRSGYSFNNGDLNSMLRVLIADPNTTLRALADAGRQRSLGRRMVQPKSANQRRYLETIEKNDMVFGIGPAGTGKTYLAVAMAISALLAKRVNRIILARPAVEAGERLGFLPGTLQDKIDPYLRPLYDALYDMLEPEKVDRYLEKNVIEIAPIAFMRGRTLNDSFVILDEAQNTTSEQMKMFVTRLGFNSKAVITGDVTQIDLPNARRSGLLEAMDVLKNVEGLAFVHFDESDVVRHQLVQRIVHAYDEHRRAAEQQMLPLMVPGEKQGVSSSERVAPAEIKG